MKCHDCKKTFGENEVMWTFVGKKRDISYGQNAKTKPPKKLEKGLWRCRDCHLKAKGKVKR